MEFLIYFLKIAAILLAWLTSAALTNSAILSLVLSLNKTKSLDDTIFAYNILSLMNFCQKMRVKKILIIGLFLDNRKRTFLQSPKSSEKLITTVLTKHIDKI